MMRYECSLIVEYCILYIVQSHPIDVVEAHRARNRPVHPPGLDNLAKAATRQFNQTAFEDQDEDENENDNDKDNQSDNENSDENGPIHRRARRYSKKSRDAAPKPTTMKYYPPGWKAMLNIAKNKMRRHIALINAFPRRETDLKVASLIVSNTIEEYKEEGNILEPGSVSLNFYLLIIDHLLGYSPDRDMSILVGSSFLLFKQLLIFQIFNEHSSFRQELKKVVRRVISLKYATLLSPPEFEVGNQLELYQLVQEGVNQSLDGGRFLRGGPDENVRFFSFLLAFFVDI